MNERDDYLWGKRGEPDPLLQALEQTLAPLAHAPRPLPLEALPPQRPTSQQPRRWPWLAAAAAAACALTWFLWRSELPLVEGAPKRDFVATATPLRIPLGELAEVTLSPGSQLRFEHWRADQVLFHLDRGELSARVAPPPAVPAGFFQVATARGLVVDQGCQYTLRIDDDGTAFVRVSEGAVTFAFPQRTVFVPAGATTTVTAFGPSTPVFRDSSPALHKTVRWFDDVTSKALQQKAPSKGGVDRRREALELVVGECREPRDSLPLWHVLSDPDPSLQELAQRALVDLVGPPPQPPQPSKGGPDRWAAAVWLPHLRTGAWTMAR